MSSLPALLSLSTLLLLPALPGADAHSRIVGFVVDNQLYEGFDPKAPANDSAVLAAWGTSVTDDGWVNYESYASPDIVCHRDAVNARGHAPVDAGDTIDVLWQGWPESHKGPILSYLAFCGEDPGDCAAVDKTDLEFFLIDQHGLVDPDRRPTDWATGFGTWASDDFIRQNSSWVVRVPETLRPGAYVLRQEWIALHFALDLDVSGPQHYPQCINLEVRGHGDDLPPGVKGMDLYHHPVLDDEPGLDYDISSSPLADYTIPGPTLWDGAETYVEQTTATITATATAIPDDPGQTLQRKRRANRFVS